MIILFYRRAHLKECFDILKKQIPTLEDKRTSNLCILRGSIRYIQVIYADILKCDKIKTLDIMYKWMIYHSWIYMVKEKLQVLANW